MKNFILFSAIFITTSLMAQEQTVGQIVQWAGRTEEFKKLVFKEHEAEFLRLIKEGQSPKALFIGCSDSRVIPELLTGTKPGDLFVIRSAGNFVPTYDPKIPWDGIAASIEYAIDVLEIKEIIVCGHTHCGAIDALYQGDKVSKFDYIQGWIHFGQPAKDLVVKYAPNLTSNEDRNQLTGRLSVLFQLEHLLSFPSIKKRVDEGRLFLHGWYFLIERGEVDYFDPQLGQFQPLRNKLN